MKEKYIFVFQNIIVVTKVSQNCYKIRRGENMEHDELRLIYEKYYKTLFLYALSLCGNQQDAEDLVHTTFLKAFLSYQSTGSIRYWLSKVLKNEFLNFQKQRARIAEESSLKLEQLSEESRILDKIILDEQKRRLFQAIMHLPLIQKNVLMDTIYFNLKDEEIANINNISRENVRQIRSRAKKKIMEMIKEEFV